MKNFIHGYEYYVLGKVINLKNVSFTEIPVNYLKLSYSKLEFIDWSNN